MTSVNTLLSEEQFMCSICLEMFNNPVTIPCGHNFCKSCITQHWNSNLLWHCPLCKAIFNDRPELKVNTFISEIASQFIKLARVKEQQCAKPGEVPCDICTGTKLKAVKSCLECMTSYCESHLEPHQRVTGLKRHELIDPVDNLEDRMCKKHNRPLQMFCKTDQVCVCQFCSESVHKLHLVVPLKEVYEEKKFQLLLTEAEIQRMIKERRLKIQQIQLSVKLSKEEADREIANSVLVFTALMHSIENSQAELISTMQGKRESTERQAKDHINELEKEISELTRKSSELGQMLHTEDLIHFLQKFSSLNVPPQTKDWTKVKIHSPSYVDTVWNIFEQLEETLKIEKSNKLHDSELKKAQQDAVVLTLDPDTANPYLTLSENGKQVYYGGVMKKLPNNPKRFCQCTCVLAKQSFSTGRLYYETEVRGKTDWSLGVVRKSVNRKAKIETIPKNGFWILSLNNAFKCIALDDPPVFVFLREKPQRVGVFVNFEEGVLSFYEVVTRAHIYTFSGCSFTEQLVPFFSPHTNEGGKNAAPLTIL